MSKHSMPVSKQLLLVCALIGTFATAALARPQEGPQQSAPPASASTPAEASPGAAAPLKFNSVTSSREATLLRRLWGIDDVHVRSTASGALVRFSYRVVDADKSKILNSKEAAPYLIDEQHGLALQVPVMEQVGQLRQVATPQNGRDYWMAFSNKGRYLKPGNHVTLIVGNLRVSGLVVE
jgi:hypothetical protein